MERLEQVVAMDAVYGQECTVCGSTSFEVVGLRRRTFLQVRCAGCAVPLVDISLSDETVCYRHSVHLRPRANRASRLVPLRRQ